VKLRVLHALSVFSRLPGLIRKGWHDHCHEFRGRDEAESMLPRQEADVEKSPFKPKDLELLVLKALAGERVSLLLGRRRYTLTVDPVFRIEEGVDGFLYLCMGLTSLRRRLSALAEGGETGKGTIAELGGAQGSH
jgi:hypothetical protein